jgi:uncharacterized protein YaaN involved in tellurite resistance
MEAIAPSLRTQEHSNLRYYIESVRKRVTNLMLWRAIAPSLHRQEYSNLRYYIESVRKRVTNLMLWRP